MYTCSLTIRLKQKFVIANIATKLLQESCSVGVPFGVTSTMADDLVKPS